MNATTAQSYSPSCVSSPLTESLRSENGMGQHYLDIRHPVVAHIRTVATLNQSSSILDLATGRGLVALALAEDRPRRRIVASDINEAGLSELSIAAHRRQLKITAVKFDVASEGLPMAMHGTFDLVTAKDLYPFLDRRGTEQFLQNTHDALVTGGRVIFTAPHRDSRLFREAVPTFDFFVRELNEEAKEFIQTTQTTFTFTDEDEIRKRLGARGFHVESSYRFGRADGWVCVTAKKI